MDGSSETRLEVARLEARVAALEALLERRSRELRLIQGHLCHRDLVIVARVAAGLAPLPAGSFDPDSWAGDTELRRAEVGETLEALWRSLDSADDGRS